jgi:hypothetical protein
MNTPVRLGLFALGLTAVFGLSLAAGQVTGPVGAAAADSGHSAQHGGRAAHAEHGGQAAPAASAVPGGLLVSDRGYTLSQAPGAAGEFAFRISGPDGLPVTGYDVEHDKRMHLITVHRDLSGFHHVHPQLGGDGIWRVASPLEGPGTYRAFADFKPAGALPLTLGVDVSVPGTTQAHPLPAPAPTTSVSGYTVALGGTLQAGRTSKLALSISRDGKPVTDLQPYLGAYGHLVALREGDLAYLHVHPDGEPGDGRTKAGPSITFYAEVPTAGTYRLYLDFQHQGTVRTAEFTATAH